MRRRFADFRRHLVRRPPEIANLRGIWGFFVGRSREGLEKVSRKARPSDTFFSHFLRKIFRGKKFLALTARTVALQASFSEPFL